VRRLCNIDHSRKTLPRIAKAAMGIRGKLEL
jgi:hypothetical protein